MTIKTIFRLAALLLLVGTAYSGSALAENKILRPISYGNVNDFLKADYGDLVRFTIDTPDGRHVFHLRRREAEFRPQFFKNDEEIGTSDLQGLFFQGTVHNKHFASSGAAADIIGNTLRLYFQGARRNRFYTAYINIEANEPNESIRLSHAHSNSTINCATETSAADVAREFSNATAQAGDTAAVYSPARVLEISTDADWEFYNSNNRDVVQTNLQIQSFLNAAEAIYLSQLGISFKLNSQVVQTNRAAQPYTSSDADQLYTQFFEVSTNTNRLGNADAFHMFTGKSMNDGVIGIARLDAICRLGKRAVGVTQRVGDALQYIVLAHELGHNLGAQHDNNTNSIMTSFVAPSHDRFSNFSIGEITSFVDEHGSCMTSNGGPTPEPTPNIEPVPFEPPVSPNDGEVNLNLSAKKQKRKISLTGAISASGETEGCNLFLFASNRKARIEKAGLPNRTNLLYVGAASQFKEISASIKTKKGKNKNYSVTFKAYKLCDDSFHESETVNLRVKLARSRSAMTKFFRRIARQVN